MKNVLFSKSVFKSFHSFLECFYYYQVADIGRIKNIYSLNNGEKRTSDT